MADKGSTCESYTSSSSSLPKSSEGNRKLIPLPHFFYSCKAPSIIHLAIVKQWVTFTAFPITEDPVSTGAGAVVGAWNVDAGVHTETRCSLQLVNFTFIHICKEKKAIPSHYAANPGQTAHFMDGKKEISGIAPSLVVFEHRKESVFQIYEAQVIVFQSLVLIYWNVVH